MNEWTTRLKYLATATASLAKTLTLSAGDGIWSNFNKNT